MTGIASNDGGHRGPSSPEVVFPLLVADVYELGGLLRRAGESVARRHGQTQARWQLLSVISAGSWTVPAAARRLGISRQAVQRVADDLVKGGQARYADNPTHRRSPLLHITKAGRRTLDAITSDAEQVNQSVLVGISTHDLEEARQTLQTISQRLQHRLEARGDDA